MIKLRYIFFFELVLLVIISSCADNNEFSSCNEWDCSNINSVDTLDYSTIFHNQHRVDFEETDNSRIGEINKVQDCDSIMFVLDCNFGRRVFLFNKDTGKFLAFIGEIGKGRGEYVMLYDFSIDKKNKKIYLLADKKRVMEYDFTGKYIQERKLDFYAVKMAYLNEMFCFVSEDKENDNLICTNKNLKVTNSYFSNKDLGDVYVRMTCPLQIVGDEYITYIKYMDNNIYKVNKDGQLSILYHVNMGTMGYDFDNAKGKTYDVIAVEAKTHNCNISSFVENENYAFITFFSNDSPVVSIYDKHERNSITYKLDNIKNSSSNSMANPIWMCTSDAFVMELTDDLFLDSNMNKMMCNPRIIKMYYKQ